MSLGAQDFASFYADCHDGQTPFLWQSRLCELAMKGDWPAVVGLPTASGKTAIIDVAVFALSAGAPGACRRVAFVVDRRVVVDEAAERAKRIATRIAERSTPVLTEVAEALCKLGATDTPLVVSVLRGGIPPDAEWARTPAQPAVLLSTVDQVGSRLLFRAYGRSGPRSWPMHAGLLGRDTLLVIDEAHCSRPFARTCREVIDRFGRWAEVEVGQRSRLVLMSATAGERPDFVLEARGHRGDGLEERLTAKKPARLVSVVAKGGRAALVERIVEEVNRLVDSGPPRVVAAVVNRVADARAVFSAVQVPEARKVLLTGRVRPWERDRLLASWTKTLKAHPKRPALAESVVVVATQCIEVGANLDFEALVTELAPLDSLRQRFGRLNRLGRPIEVVASIVGLETKDDDPVYGSALAATWTFLSERATTVEAKVGKKKLREQTIDFGVDSMDDILNESPPEEGVESLCAPTLDPPMLMPAHLDLLAQTSPPPSHSPDVAQLLHGLGSRTADVSIVWRADILGGQEDAWVGRVAVQPPSSAEGCSVPLWAFRRWMDDSATEDVADVDVASDDVPSSSGRRVLRWRGDDSELVRPRDIRPGDVVVVPATWGACDSFGWNPSSTSPVGDIGDVVASRARARAVLRLDVEVVKAWDVTDSVRAAHARSVLVDPEASAAQVRDALDELDACVASDSWVRSVTQKLRQQGTVLVDAGGASALVTRSVGAGDRPDLGTADDTSSLTVRVSLQEHSRGVETWARTFAAACLPAHDDLARSVALAAWLHDIGKADPRFQTWLFGGDEVAAAMSPELIAKSGANPRNRAAIERARRAAGYPRGTRHEMLSTAMILASEDVERHAKELGCDWDLVLHLVASHHGFARPFPPVPDDDPEPAHVVLEHGGVRFAATTAHRLHRADSGVAARYWRLVGRYGWHGLAYLEAILRLADHRRSEEEEVTAAGAAS